jgi:hypothetical protein
MTFTDDDLKRLKEQGPLWGLARQKDFESLLARLEAAEAFSEGFSKIDYLLHHHSYCKRLDPNAGGEASECNCVIGELKTKFQVWRKAAGK